MERELEARVDPVWVLAQASEAVMWIVEEEERDDGQKHHQVDKELDRAIRLVVFSPRDWAHYCHRAKTDVRLAFVIIHGEIVFDLGSYAKQLIEASHLHPKEKKQRNLRGDEKHKHGTYVLLELKSVILVHLLHER